MTAPFLSDAAAGRIAALRERGYLTRRQLADPSYTLTFRAPDGTVVVADVLVVWAATQPVGSGRESTVAALGQDGEVQVWGAFPVPTGSTFMLGGDLAEITIGPITERGLTRAGFRVARDRG